MNLSCVNDFIFFVEMVLRRAKTGSLSGDLQECYLKFKDEEGEFLANFQDEGTAYGPAILGKSFRQALEERLGNPSETFDRTVLTSSILPFLHHVFDDDINPYVSIDIEDLSVDVPDVTMGVSRQLEGDLTIYYKFSKDGAFILGTCYVECLERIDPHLPSPESVIDWAMALSHLADHADCDGWRPRQIDRHLILSCPGKKDMDASYENGRLRVDVTDGPSVLVDDTPGDIWTFLELTNYFGKIPDKVITRHWNVLGFFIYLANELGGYVETIPGHRIRVRVDYPDRFVRVNVDVSGACYMEIEHFGEKRWIKFLILRSTDAVKDAIVVMKNSSFDAAAIDTFRKSLTHGCVFSWDSLPGRMPPSIKFKDNTGFADTPLTSSVQKDTKERSLEEPEIQLRIKGMGVSGEMLNSLTKSWMSLQKQGYSTEEITDAIRQEIANQTTSNEAESGTGGSSPENEDEKRHRLERAMADTVMEMSSLYMQEEVRDVFDAAMEDAYPDPEEKERPVEDDEDEDDEISGGPDLYAELEEDVPGEISGELYNPTEEFEEIINTYGSDFEGQPIGRVRFSHEPDGNGWYSTATWVDTQCPVKLKLECWWELLPQDDFQASKWVATVNYDSRVFRAERNTLDEVIQDYNETFNALFGTVSLKALMP